MIGVKTFYAVLADVAVTASTALVTVGLKSPLAALQRQKFRAYIPISVGAAGGVKFQVVVPGGAGSVYLVSYKIVNTVAPLTTTGEIVATASVGIALANAGNHWLEIEGYIKNGATAGFIDIQMAQNTSDATPMTALQGGSLDITIY